MALKKIRIKNFKSLVSTLQGEKKRLTEFLKRVNKKGASNLIDFEIFKKKQIVEIDNIGR